MRNRLMLLMLAFGGVLSVSADSREDFMADFVKGDRFYQNNASREEFFNLPAFFFDFNGDGVEEALVSELQDTDGWEWEPLYRNREGKVEIGGPHEKVWKDPVAYIRGWGRLFYRANFAGGFSSILGRQIEISYSVSEKPSDLRQGTAARPARS